MSRISAALVRLRPQRQLLLIASSRARSERIHPIAIKLNLPPRRNLSTSSLPTILQPAFWRSLTPKAFRSPEHPTDPAEPSDPSTSPSTTPTSARKPWNPATFFIVIFMLIGSQAIQLITLNRNFDLFSYQTEAKLGRLREVVKRIRAGEQVDDVVGLLGQGDEKAEREWEDVMKELEEEEMRLSYMRKERKHRTMIEEQRRKAAEDKGDHAAPAVSAQQSGSRGARAESEESAMV